MRSHSAAISRAALLRGVAAGDDLVLVHRAQFLTHRGLEGLDAAGRGIVRAEAADEVGLGAPRICDIWHQLEDLPGQHFGAQEVVADDRGRVPAGKVDVDVRQVCRLADHAERIGVGGARDEQMVDRVGDQGLDGADLLGRVAQGRNDHRAPAAFACMCFERLAHRGEEAVVVHRQDQPHQARSRLPQPAGLQVGGVAVLGGERLDPERCRFADPPVFPGAVQRGADGRGRGPAQFRQIVDGRLWPGVRHGRERPDAWFYDFS